MKILNGIAFTAQPQAPAFELGWRLWLGGKRNCEVDHHIKRSQRTPAEDHKALSSSRARCQRWANLHQRLRRDSHVIHKQRCWLISE